MPCFLQIALCLPLPLASPLRLHLLPPFLVPRSQGLQDSIRSEVPRHHLQIAFSTHLDRHGKLIKKTKISNNKQLDHDSAYRER